MNVNRIIAELRSEKQMVDETILILERLAVRTPRRGRPPKWISTASATTSTRESRLSLGPAK
jgi:hypothetical protein